MGLTTRVPRPDDFAGEEVEMKRIICVPEKRAAMINLHVGRNSSNVEGVKARFLPPISAALSLATNEHGILMPVPSHVQLLSWAA